MTIKICHNKFDNLVHKSWIALTIIIKIGIFASLPIGLFLGFYVVDWNMSISGDESVQEYIHNLNMKTLSIIMPILGGGATFVILFVNPFLYEYDNFIQKLNKKYKWFVWNEDC